MLTMETNDDTLTKRYRVEVKQEGLSGWLAIASFDTEHEVTMFLAYEYDTEDEEFRIIDAEKGA